PAWGAAASASWARSSAAPPPSTAAPAAPVPSPLIKERRDTLTPRPCSSLMAVLFSLSGRWPLAFELLTAVSTGVRGCPAADRGHSVLALATGRLRPSRLESGPDKSARTRREHRGRRPCARQSA